MNHSAKQKALPAAPSKQSVKKEKAPAAKKTK